MLFRLILLWRLNRSAVSNALLSSVRNIHARARARARVRDAVILADCVQIALN